MEKNNKGPLMIRSIRELDSSQQRQVRLAAIAVGSLVFLIYVLVILLIDDLPDLSAPFWSVCIHSTLLFVFAILAIHRGGLVGCHLMLADLGFALPTRQQQWADTLTTQQAFSSDIETHYSSSQTYSSHMSINPSSGLPMSGSSGMDTSGNPFGTRSW